MARRTQNSGKNSGLKPWKKGQSGNPGGRPKKRGDLVSRCTAAVDELVVTAWIAEVKEHGADWVKCSELLAAYAYGRPSQKLEHDVGATFEQLVRDSMGLKS